MELFALKLQQWERNGLEQVMALLPLLESFTSCLYSHFIDQSLSPSAERGAVEGKGKRRSCWVSPPGLGVGWACPGEQAWEDLSLALASF